LLIQNTRSVISAALAYAKLTQIAAKNLKRAINKKLSWLQERDTQEIP
jgi:hypothetical protein